MGTGRIFTTPAPSTAYIAKTGSIGTTPRSCRPFQSIPAGRLGAEQWRLHQVRLQGLGRDAQRCPDRHDQPADDRKFAPAVKTDSRTASAAAAGRQRPGRTRPYRGRRDGTYLLVRRLARPADPLQPAGVSSAIRSGRPAPDLPQVGPGLPGRRPASGTYPDPSRQPAPVVEIRDPQTSQNPGHRPAPGGKDHVRQESGRLDAAV